MKKVYMKPAEVVVNVGTAQSLLLTESRNIRISDESGDEEYVKEETPIIVLSSSNLWDDAW